jgi:hypothetical protein
MGTISKARLYTIIYGEHNEELVASIEFPCQNIAAKAVHNPMPLKKMLDEVAPWAV